MSEAAIHLLPSCGGGCSAAPEPASLGMEPPDSGVDLGSLVAVDPPRWDPFPVTIRVDPAQPAFLQEVGVVVPAEHRQIV